MRVQSLYTDSSGTYRVDAEVREHNRTIHIIEVVDNDYGGEVEWDDFTDDEQSTICNLLLEEYDALAAEDPDLDEDLEEDQASDY